jgi:CheY-like chemotaxis protein
MFLANMSHELRTPLNAIIGFSQILQTKQEIPDNLKTYIEKISISGKNLLNLVNTILDFAKIEAGKISYHPKMTMIIDVIREVEAIVSTLAQNKNITLEFPGDISVAMYIDEQLIKQVLINLFSNAIKFTPKGGKVSMRINFKKEQEEYIISVCDTGVGISKENIYKLFTSFTQIDNELQPSTKGSGLGLVISKKIIEDLHEGRIWVESEEGKGSCFYIALPISHENGIVEIFPSLNKNSEKILIVEDSEEYASLLVKKLNKVFDITLTNSVEKAKELLNTKKFDVIVLDFFLVDGVSSEIIDFMEEQNIEIPIFVISAEDDIKLITYLGESNNIVGVFNKNNTELICDTILRGQND